VIRVRRHPLAGATLLAILTPLLAAGPGMPCAGDDASHHEAVGHVIDSGAAGHAGSHHASHGAAHHDGARSALSHHASLAPAPDTRPDAPEPMACAMGMMCSGTVVAPLTAAIAGAPVVRSAPRAATLWSPHTADLSLPDRPPRV
jgi:hypothetical protein